MVAPLLSTFVSALLLLSLTQPAVSTRKMNVVWPRAVIRGSTAVMWVDVPAAGNVTIRLTAEQRVYEDKTIPILQPGIIPLELAIPLHYDGQLMVRLLSCDVIGAADCRDGLALPVHPLEPIQSLSLRVEKTIYQAHDIVSIWLACRDHHGRLITEAGINAQVAAHDPSNAIVQYWNVALSSTGSGIKNLQLRLSDAPPLGVWTVRASAGDQTASQTFELVDAINDSVASAASAVDASHPSPTVSTVLIVEPHFVELNFSPRTASSIRQGSPFVGELVAGTSEKGLTVGVDVLDHLGTSLHHQTVHLNKTASAVFTIPGLVNLTSNATLQATLQSIEGQPLDNQFVLATHSINIVKNNKGEEEHCNVQLFSQDGLYRFKEGDTLHLTVYTDCECIQNGQTRRSDRINYAVTSRSSGHVISWGQAHWAIDEGEANHSLTTMRQPAKLGLSIPITYEMIPRSIVTVFFQHGHDLVSSSLDIGVDDNHAGSTMALVETVRNANNVARVNVSLVAGNYHCVYGSWGHRDMTVVQSSETSSSSTSSMSAFSSSPPSIETDRFLRLLPKFQQLVQPWELFGSGQLWFARCYQPTETTWRVVETTVPARLVRPQLMMVTVTPDGSVRRSSPLPIAVKAIPWTIDFQLPESVRVGEEMVVDVTLTSHTASNCSQTQLQMALTGGATFVANGKKFLQQPACLGSLNNGQLARSVYRVGIQVGEVSSHHASVTMTVQLRGYTNSSCCAPLSNTIGLVVDLDVHQELMETLPVSKSTSVLAADWHHFHSENYLFCLGENTFVSNTSSFDYEILPLPRHGRKTLVFQVSAAAELRVALMEEDPREDGDGTGPSYHIVLGGEDNMNTWISKHMNGLMEVKAKVATPKLLRQDRLQTFWISWDQQKLARKKRNKPNYKVVVPPTDNHRLLLSIGKGSHLGARTLISIPLDANDSPFRFVGFSTGWGIRGFFRVWGTAKTVEQTIRTLSVMKPSIIVPSNNERAELTIRGGVASCVDSIWQSVADPSTLIGVLERFYRERGVGSHHNKSDVNWNQLLQNILSFRLPDGSFRGADGQPDLRLTALTINVLSAIKSQSYSDPTLIKSALLWMHGRQNEDGSFSPCLVDRRNVTAFIVSCLVDVQHDDIVLYQVISAAQRYLERELGTTNDLRAVVPMAAAAMASHSTSWPVWMARMDNIYDALLECTDCWSEMTYALAAYFHQNRPEKVLEIVKSLVSAPWETLHPLDRVRSMKVWSKYGQALNDPVRDLHLRLTFQNGDVATGRSLINETQETMNGTGLPVPLVLSYDDEDGYGNETHTMALEEHQSLRMHTPPLTYEVPNGLPQNVELTVAGTGCAVLQTKVHWKTQAPYPAPNESQIGLFATVEVDKEELPSNLTALLCVQWNGTELTDLRIRMEMFSSFDISSVTTKEEKFGLKYSLRKGNVTINIDQIRPQCGRCVTVRAVRSGMVRGIQPARIEVYDKKRPQFPRYWLLSGPSASSQWVAGTASYMLNSRPKICT